MINQIDDRVIEAMNRIANTERYTEEEAAEIVGELFGYTGYQVEEMVHLAAQEEMWQLMNGAELHEVIRG